MSLGVALAAHLLSLLFCLRNIRTLQFQILSLLAVEEVFSLISDLDSESYTRIFSQQLVDIMPSLGFSMSADGSVFSPGEGLLIQMAFCFYLFSFLLT